VGDFARLVARCRDIFLPLLNLRFDRADRMQQTGAMKDYLKRILKKNRGCNEKRVRYISLAIFWQNYQEFLVFMKLLPSRIIHLSFYYRGGYSKCI
jgi:hypothetical protein